MKICTFHGIFKVWPLVSVITFDNTQNLIKTKQSLYQIRQKLCTVGGNYEETKPLFLQKIN